MSENALKLSTKTIRRRARVLMWLVTLPLVGLGLLAAALLALQAISGGRYLVLVLILYFPMFLYIWAIWMVRQALKAIADGRMFGDVVPRLLFRVGLALFGGALFGVGAPILSAIVFRHSAMPSFDASTVTLGVVGAALALIAQLLQRAADMRDELDEFF